MRIVSLAVSVLVFGSSLVMSAPKGWVKGSKADLNTIVQITLPVKQSNLDLLDSLFWQVSDPKSPMYAQYLTFDQVGKLVQNEPATKATIAYLKKMGVEEIEAPAYGSYIKANLTAGLVDKLFGTELHLFTHPKHVREILKSEVKPQVPEELAKFVEFVPHLSYFPDVRRRVKHTKVLGLKDLALAAASSSSSSDEITPSKLIERYVIDNVTVTHGANQSLFEALGQSFSNSDLNLFQKTYNLLVQNVSSIIGTNTASECSGSAGESDCAEASLDVQYIMAIAQGAQTNVWSISSSSSDPFLDWSEAAAATSSLYLVQSISYGGYEENSDGVMTTFNTEVQKLGLQGVTVLVSSGDDGVANIDAAESFLFCGYYPSFPASSPFVTAVGATQGVESDTTEIACSSSTGGIITSGGGFSNIYAMPSYQKSAVADYFGNLTSSNKPKSGYNTTGRGYPDVAVAGYNYPVAIGGAFDLVSGTSASAPVFAGMITLINDARLAAGKAPLGFLNQALYSLPSTTWNDITSGNNKCPAEALICCSQGFYATAGWDPVTGFGSPKFDKLKAALLAL